MAQQTLQVTRPIAMAERITQPSGIEVIAVLHGEVRADNTATIIYQWTRSSTDSTLISFTNDGTVDSSYTGNYIYAAPLSPVKLDLVRQKAKELLLAHLSESQRKTWLKNEYFDVQAPSGRRYRLQKGYFHNVFLLDIFNKKVREYCAYAKDPNGSLPVEDNLFAQLMTLRFNENEFLAMANTWDLTKGKVFVGQGVDAHKPAEDLTASAA